MSQVFYHVEGGEALQFCQAHKTQFLEKQREFAAYSESKGGRGYTESWGFFGGVIFGDDAEIPPGFVPHKRKTRDGYPIHVPNRKSAVGKELAKEFEALGRFPIDDLFCDRFNIPQSIEFRKTDECYGTSALHSGGGFKTCQILWIAEDFWLVLPDIDKEVADYKAKGYTTKPDAWTVPEGVVRSTEARYNLALAQHKVDMEERETANVAG